MKIKARRRFKEDYERLEKKLKNSAPLRKALFRATSILQQGKDLSEEYTVNRLLTQGQGWYACYFYEDFIVIYKIQGQYVRLSRLGTAKELGKEAQKFFGKICKVNLTLCTNYHTLSVVGYMRACIWKGQKNESDTEKCRLRVDSDSVYAFHSTV